MRPGQRGTGRGCLRAGVEPQRRAVLARLAPRRPAGGSPLTRTEQKPHEGNAIAMSQLSLPALLQERANQQPDAPAYTFIDYQIDPAGFAECLTWAQVHHRALVVAEELRLCGAVGGRAAILAPEGLDYIVAFLGALQA